MRKTKLSRLEATLLAAPESLIVRIVSFWDLPDIIACDTLSAVFHNIVRYYKAIVWDPDKFFRPWFIEDPALFRRMLGECGGAVSGSQITQFFDRTSYQDSDLDIFLRIGRLHQMGQWLRGQGYVYTSSTAEYEALSRKALRLSTKMIIEKSSPDDTIRGVFNYTRYIASLTVIYVQKIQLIVVDSNPVDHIIFDFHSTAVINYMVSDAVVSVFPVPTLFLHKSYVVRATDASLSPLHGLVTPATLARISTSMPYEAILKRAAANMEQVRASQRTQKFSKTHEGPRVKGQLA
ncbi:hypothetical protein C8R47DRAFT_1208153 [Mycena vitilis]|nr:hypothetical protein C8R47DRAFT_1208153 [Mycena vitilis]